MNFDFNRGPTRRRALLWAALTSAALLTAGCGTGGLQTGAADKARGKQLFVEKCGSCHTLADAGTQGRIGPNLDDAFSGSRAAGFRRVDHPQRRPRPDPLPGHEPVRGRHRQERHRDQGDRHAGQARHRRRRERRRRLRRLRRRAAPGRRHVHRRDDDTCASTGSDDDPGDDDHADDHDGDDDDHHRRRGRLRTGRPGQAGVRDRRLHQLSHAEGRERDRDGRPEPRRREAVAGTRWSSA